MMWEHTAILPRFTREVQLTAVVDRQIEDRLEGLLSKPLIINSHESPVIDGASDPYA
jgi:hypothetical protein